METVYVNNYRGFDDSYIWLKKVNFLVGENSTGKTSLIEIINILNDARFWFNYDINASEIENFTFDDMKSKVSKEKFFSIGSIEYNDDEKQNVMNIVKYVEVEGMPVFEDVWICNKYGIALFSIDGNKCKYKYKLNDKEENDLVKTYKETIANIAFKSTNYKSIDLPNYNMFFTALYEIEEADKEIKKIIGGNGLRTLGRNAGSTIIAPIRAKPKSVYTGGKKINSPEGEHTPFIIRSLLETKEDQASQKLVELINIFGKESGLFDSLSISTFGKKKTAPFELDIVKYKHKFKISTVGYGVSQILPVIVELIMKRGKGIFTIQQPEVHLHPKAQAAFGEFLYSIAAETDATFIVETHSDYLIDRFRYMKYESAKKVDSQVLYFINENCKNSATSISIENNGRYENDQPIEFREFFLNESIKYLEI